jgi:hypothetical protein
MRYGLGLCVSDSRASTGSILMAANDERAGGICRCTDERPPEEGYLAYRVIRVRVSQSEHRVSEQSSP